MTQGSIRKCFFCGKYHHRGQRIKYVGNIRRVRSDGRIYLSSCMIGKRVKVTLHKEEKE